jgi:hypothetical protein
MTMTMKITQTDRIAATAVNARNDDCTTKRAGTAEVTEIAGVTEITVIAPAERPPVSRSSACHDAFFVTQLIAVAQHSPQTRVLRRAEPQVAQAAYHSTSGQNQDGAQAAPRLLRVV